MSEHISWEECPHCHDRAAVGWVAVPELDGGPADEFPVEFDCPAGCHLSTRELAKFYGTAGARGW